MFSIFYIDLAMGYSPFLRAVGFWGSFYLFYHYSRRNEDTQRHVYPSYMILKEKIVKDQWKQGPDADRFQEAFSLYTGELWKEIKSINN